MSKQHQIASDGADKNDKLSQVKYVDIDETGTFKYILLKVTNPKCPEDFKMIVRGYGVCEYHMDIFDEVAPGIAALGLRVDCPGGGRIKHEPEKGSIKIYGYSQGYGKADHELSVEIVKKAFPKYSSISCSDEGY